MTKEAIVSLPTDKLWAIVRSTFGGSVTFAQELSWAKAELQRRANKGGKRLIGL
jgi:hypothetical protein